MDPEIKTKPPRSSSFLAAEVNTNTNKTHLAENSEERNLKRWSVVIEAEGEIFISFLPLEPEGWPRNFAKFGVTPDGDIFINPAILSDGARLAALISGVAVWIAGGPLLAPLSWAEANYPEQAEMLHDLGMYIRESVSCSFPREKTSRQVPATEDHANGNK